MSVTSVCTCDVISVNKICTYAGGNRLFSDVEMYEPQYISFRKALCCLELDIDKSICCVYNKSYRKIS